MIPEHVMKELRYIEVFTDRKIRNQRVGTYQSPQRGPGFDFDEHQPYRPGDDVRRIDWNVTARMGAPFVRHTHAEREMNVMVAMDVSRSMALGTTKHSKRETMTFITGSILFSALSDQINTGFVAFGDKVLLSTQPRRTRAAAWSVLEQAWALKPSLVEDADAAARPPPHAHAQAHEPDLHRVGLRHERRRPRAAPSWRTWRTSTTSSRWCRRIARKRSCRPAAATCTCATSSPGGGRLSASAGRRATGMPRPSASAARRSGARVLSGPHGPRVRPDHGQPGAAGAVALCQEKSVIRRSLPRSRSSPPAVRRRSRRRRARAAPPRRPRRRRHPGRCRCAPRSTARRSGSAIASPISSRSSAGRGVEILLDDLAKEKLRVNGLDVVGSDDDDDHGRVGADDLPAPLRAGDVSTWTRRRCRSSRSRPATTSGVPGSGCRTSRPRARCRSPAP